jgi:hypothetical protein
MKVDGGDFIVRCYSGGISFQNVSPGEKSKDYFILTWNSGNNTRYRIIYIRGEYHDRGN